MDRRIRAWAGTATALVLAGALWFLVRDAERTRASSSPVRLPASNGSEATPVELSIAASGARSASEPETRVSLEADAEPAARPRKNRDHVSGDNPVLGDIHGRVVDTQGLPVPGARILLERRRRLVVDADASGRFELRGLEPDDHRLTVLAEGLPDGFAPRRHVCEGGAVTGTRADGSFLFEGLFPKRYGVSVGPSGYVGYRRIFARDHSWLT